MLDLTVTVWLHWISVWSKKVIKKGSDQMCWCNQLRKVVCLSLPKLQDWKNAPGKPSGYGRKKRTLTLRKFKLFILYTIINYREINGSVYTLYYSHIISISLSAVQKYFLYQFLSWYTNCFSWSSLNILDVHSQKRHKNCH